MHARECRYRWAPHFKWGVLHIWIPLDRVHGRTRSACDFATIDTVTLCRFYLLFFIDIPTRTVYFAGITDHPTGVRATQAARNLFLRYADGLAGTRALVRDRGNQFIDAFDEIFRTERMKILKTPVRTPVANAFTERWIGTHRDRPS